MINVKNAKSYCCEDISLIENYQEAVASPDPWVCHHRLGITPEGKTLTHEELDAMGLYKKRPASELIFMKRWDHRSLHRKGRKASEATRKKQSLAHSGEKAFMYGKHHTEAAKEKQRQANLGMKWFNDGTICIRAKECPEGFVPGRLANSLHWYTDGVENVKAQTCPEGFHLGRTCKRKAS